MEDRTGIDRFIITIITVACIGLSVESIMQGWEFWVPPLFIAGAVVLWIIHINQKVPHSYREILYLTYGMFCAFFHGAHATSFYDVSIVAILLLGVYSLFDRIIMLNLILAEYAVIIVMQIIVNARLKTIVFDSLSISRILLHIMVVVCIYCLSRSSVSRRAQNIASGIEMRERRLREVRDMEDFLSNISHELRTPVNVVNGMSTLLYKNEGADEVKAIRVAGIRLSRQIEDIQDFTEIKQNGLVLETEKYESTSLINDVVSGFTEHEKRDFLELIIDMDPKVPRMMMGDIKKIHKVFRLLLDNALKFTREGGVYVKIFALKREYGVNLTFEVTDTGIGMSAKDIAAASEGLYQANSERNRSTGGVGLGLPIVYGFVHKMGGFVKIDSSKGKGTTVRAVIPQEVIDPSPCLSIDRSLVSDIIYFVRPEKYLVPELRDFYRSMAVNSSLGLELSLYSATSMEETRKLLKTLTVSHVFMGQEEYEGDEAFFDKLCEEGIVVAVSANPGFSVSPGSRVIVLPKPLYAFPLVKVLNGETRDNIINKEAAMIRPLFKGVRALIVDDEPMNLVVATGLFREYQMLTDTADSGMEAIDKYMAEDYDIIFMDHMMPEMDGVKAMKRIKEYGNSNGRNPIIVALTANAVSGAREMFMREGFDGFIAKPIDINDFERVMRKILPESMIYDSE